eukprot:25496-Rhodomonas_salina.1
MEEVQRLTGIAYIIFSNSAFPLTSWTQRMLKGVLDQVGHCFNALMAQLRICIKNVFREIHRDWGYTSFHLQLKLGSQPVGAVYHVANHLHNCAACLHGNQMT